MNVVVDTSIWSQALRHGRKSSAHEAIKNEMVDLINESRIILLGCILQELLSGIKHSDQYNLLKSHLSSFDIETPKREYFEKAAVFFNECRLKGIQGSHIDFYICAVANINNWSIYSNDRDFNNFAEIIKIKMHKCRY